jgi:hypothetical protein
MNQAAQQQRDFLLFIFIYGLIRFWFAIRLARANQLPGQVVALALPLLRQLAL